jgi:glyoxylase-like metal-dependent hydrolase (beta-lactamase superfamily II)
MPRLAVRAGSLVATLLACATAWPQAANVAPAGIEVQRLRPGLHLLGGAGSNVVAWSGADGTVLVDSGTAAAAPQLVEAVAGVATGSAVRFVVNTHWHPDHTGGNEAFAKAGALLISHDGTRATMAQPQELREYDLRVPAAARTALPVVTFGDELTLNLNGGRLSLLHVPSAHTDGDCIAWWRDANVVHMGDLYYAGGYPLIDTQNGGSLAGLVAAIETVLSRADARTVVVPGHGAVGTRPDLVAYRDMLVTIGRRVRELVEQGGTLEEVLAARPTAAYDERYARGGVNPERFVRVLFEDLSASR